MRINIEINLFASRTITSFLFSLETNDISTLFANWSRKLQIRLWNLKQIFIQSDKLMIRVQQWIVTVDICQNTQKLKLKSHFVDILNYFTIFDNTVLICDHIQVNCKDCWEIVEIGWCFEDTWWMKIFCQLNQVTWNQLWTI